MRYWLSWRAEHPAFVRPPRADHRGDLREVRKDAMPQPSQRRGGLEHANHEIVTGRTLAVLWGHGAKCGAFIDPARVLGQRGTLRGIRTEDVIRRPDVRHARGTAHVHSIGRRCTRARPRAEL